MEVSENLLNSVIKNIIEKNLDALYVKEIIKAEVITQKCEILKENYTNRHL